MEPQYTASWVWSRWYGYNNPVALKNIPDSPGIYEVKTDFKIERLNGFSPVVTIGVSRTSLYDRRVKQKAGNEDRHLNRVEKWLKNNNHKLYLKYSVCTSKEDALLKEAICLWKYENKHWELPPGNDKLEKSPIVKRVNDKFGSGKNLINKIERGEITIKEASATLALPIVIIENYLVYRDVE